MPTITISLVELIRAYAKPPQTPPPWQPVTDLNAGRKRGILAAMRAKPTVVKEYQSRRQMQRGIERMGRRGYHVQRTSGEFTHNPFVFRWNRRRVVVTYELARDESPAASPVTG